MNKDDHTIKYLVEALRKAGLVKYKNYRSARQMIQYWIKSGKLQLRQSRRNNYYLINDKEVKEIIKQLSYKGEGFYHAQL